LLAFRVACLKVVKEKKAKSSDRVSRDECWPIREDHNAGCQDDRYHNQSGARQGNSVPDDNSYCSHERQTNKRLARRIQEFHCPAFPSFPLGKASSYKLDCVEVGCRCGRGR
jgi:hypothetical protein